MGAESGLLAASFAAQSASSAAGGYAQGQALRAQADYESTMANINARNAELEADDALKRGEMAAQEARKKSKQLQGAQRAAAAASGISADTGSVAELRAEADLFGKIDADQIRNNAWREAFGLKAQAAEVKGRAKFNSQTARIQARQSLLTGGMNAVAYGAQGYAHYKGEGKKPK